MMMHPLLTAVAMLRFVLPAELAMCPGLSLFRKVACIDRVTGRLENDLVSVVILSSDRLAQFVLGRIVIIENALPARAFAPLKMMALILVSALRQPEFPTRMFSPEVLLTLLKKSSGMSTMSVYG